MANDLQKWLEFIENNPVVYKKLLREKLMCEANKKSFDLFIKEVFIPEAAKHDFHFSFDNVEDFNSNLSKQVLNLDQLEEVTGGKPASILATGALAAITLISSVSAWTFFTRKDNSQQSSLSSTSSSYSTMNRKSDNKGASGAGNVVSSGIVNDGKADLAQMFKDYAQVKREKDDLATRVQEANDQQTKANTIVKTEADKNLIDENKNLRNQLDEYKKAGNSDDEIEKLRASVRDLQQQLAVSRQETADARIQIANLQSELEKYKSHADEVKEVKTEAKTADVNVSNGVKQVEKEKSNTDNSAKITDKGVTNEQSKEEKGSEGSKQSLKTAEQEKSLEDKSDIIEGEKESLQEKKKELQQNLETAEQEKSTAQESDTIKEKDRQIEQLNERIKTLEERIKQLSEKEGQIPDQVGPSPDIPSPPSPPPPSQPSQPLPPPPPPPAAPAVPTYSSSESLEEGAMEAKIRKQFEKGLGLKDELKTLCGFPTDITKAMRDGLTNRINNVKDPNLRKVISDKALKERLIDHSKLKANDAEKFEAKLKSEVIDQIVKQTLESRGVEGITKLDFGEKEVESKGEKYKVLVLKLNIEGGESINLCAAGKRRIRDYSQLKVYNDAKEKFSREQLKKLDARVLECKQSFIKAINKTLDARGKALVQPTTEELDSLNSVENIDDFIRERAMDDKTDWQLYEALVKTAKKEMSAIFAAQGQMNQAVNDFDKEHPKPNIDSSGIINDVKTLLEKQKRSNPDVAAESQEKQVPMMSNALSYQTVIKLRSIGAKVDKIDSMLLSVSDIKEISGICSEVDKFVQSIKDQFKKGKIFSKDVIDSYNLLYKVFQKINVRAKERNLLLLYNDKFKIGDSTKADAISKIREAYRALQSIREKVPEQVEKNNSSKA